MPYANTIGMEKLFRTTKIDWTKWLHCIQRAIMKKDDTRVFSVAMEIMSWGGVDNVHRQKRTFAWIKQNARSISKTLKEARPSNRRQHKST